MTKLDPKVRAYLTRRTARQVRNDQLLVVMEALRWNVSAAARALGITRRSVYLWVRTFGIGDVGARRQRARRKAWKPPWF